MGFGLEVIVGGVFVSSFFGGGGVVFILFSGRVATFRGGVLVSFLWGALS